MLRLWSRTLTRSEERKIYDHDVRFGHKRDVACHARYGVRAHIDVEGGVRSVSARHIGKVVERGRIPDVFAVFPLPLVPDRSARVINPVSALAESDLTIFRL